MKTHGGFNVVGNSQLEYAPELNYCWLLCTRNSTKVEISIRIFTWT